MLEKAEIDRALNSRFTVVVDSNGAIEDVIEHKLFDDIKPKKIIFSKPATIIIWDDGVKTVVKCQDDEPYDAEKGIALCYMKRFVGNKGNYNNVFKKWITEEED